MKQCPICQALAFDDAAVCFGCLHKFGPDDALAPIDPPAACMPSDAPPSFLIQIKPERNRSGQTAWTCTVDLV